MGDDYHSGGAFELAYAFAWMSGNAVQRNAPTDQPSGRFKLRNAGRVRFFSAHGRGPMQAAVHGHGADLELFMAHGTYDEYWQSRNVPKDLNNITFPGADRCGLVRRPGFSTARSGCFIRSKKRTKTNKTTLVVGPWTHGAWGRGAGDSIGAIKFGSRTATTTGTRLNCRSSITT